MSPTPTVDYSSTTSAPHTGNDTMLAAAGAQLVASISTGKKGLSGSIIAGATIGGIVVAILIVALFFGLRHHYRRSRGQTASTAEAAPENEHEKEKCTEANESSSGHCLAQVVTYQSGAVQEAPSDVVVCQSGVPSPSSPRRSSDSSGTLPTQINHYNITTHAPRPQSYRMCPCPSCVLAPTATSALTEADISVGSPKGEYQIYDRNSCLPSTSPPLPPGAMPPLPSPTLESYQENFRTSPPPQSPSSPGGSSLRRWIMTPLSRSGTIRTPLPAYERPGSGLQRRVSDKKDESALAASVYTFM